MTSQTTAEPALTHTVEGVRCFQLTFRSGGTEIGRAQLHSSSSHVLEVVDLFVEPEFRGNGHARAILRQLMDFARNRGASAVSAHTSPDNTAAYSAFVGSDFAVHHQEVHMEHPISANQTAEAG